MKTIDEHDFQELKSGCTRPLIDSFTNDNVQAFILKVATNIWSSRQKKDRKILPFDPYIVDGYFSKRDTDFVLDDDRQRQIDVCMYALKKLGNPCELILRRSLMDRIPLRNLAEELGYKNKDVMKTIKARCMKKLKKLIKELMQK